MMFLRSIFSTFYRFIFILALSGCGFVPIYDEGTRQNLAQIHVLPIAEREGQVLKTALKAQFNPNGLKIASAYNLDLTLQTIIVESFSGEIRRAKAILSVRGQLRDREGRVLWSGNKSRSALFLRHELPSLAQQAQNDIWEDLANLLARDISLTLAQAL